MTAEEETQIIEKISREVITKKRLLYSYEIREILDQFIVKNKQTIWEQGYEVGLAQGHQDGVREVLSGFHQGEWINHRNDYGHNIADCSLCGKTMQWHDEDGDGVPKYCWYCGAPMKGVKND